MSKSCWSLIKFSPICDNLESSYLRKSSLFCRPCRWTVGRLSTVSRTTDFGRACFSILPWRWGGRVKYETILVGLTWWIVGGVENTQNRTFDISSTVLKDSQQRWHEKKATSAEFFNFCQLFLIICCSVLFCLQKIETLEHRMYTHPLHKDSSLESLYSLCEQKATVSLFRLCSLLYYILYTSNGASFLPMMLMGHFTFANNVNGVLRVHQHCSWSVTCWLLMLLGCWSVLM